MAPEQRRRAFLEAMAGLAVASAASGAVDSSPPPSPSRRLRFAAIGLNHGHVYAQVDDVVRGGGELVAFHAKEPELATEFGRRFPAAKRAREEREVLEDASIPLVVSAAIPDERAALAVRAMQHAKDFMVDKPGATTLEQLAELRRVQAQTGRIWSVWYGRLADRALCRAAELVRAGAVGRVLQTIGLGPHRMDPASRPPWFFEKARYGGILCDLASHQADQFLFFTGSTRFEVVASQTGNLGHRDRPGLEDFGDMLVRGDGGTGYARVDWFTPGGLRTWGDGRFTVLGADGFLEVRQNADLGGRPGGNHLFLVDQKETRYVDCRDQPLPAGGQLVSDVLARTETAMSQAHCFLATELALRAEAAARRIA
ncbi:MAG TPA: Gfo/Idh/MocA family oxidoreductase [Vicinamibacteria bacterium]|nr:Gfo/Idh/MocA family oxidoreductase [Vicinamibacteria bacterium]